LNDGGEIHARHEREQIAQLSFPGLLSALSVVTAICLVTGTSTRVLACFGPVNQMTVFYDEVPDGVDAPVIVQVRIIDVSNTHPAGYFVGIGKVEKVIQGNVDRDTVRVLSVISDCELRYPVGAHGIVMGDMQRDSNGEIEILAIPESFGVRRNKKVFDPTQ
jgi:hypothetical protein